MKGKGKKKVVVDKEINSEDWCFVCKDGGDLRICDYKECLKSYHPHCVGKDESFLNSKSYWRCSQHNCFKCRRSSHRHCYTCPTSVCSRCFPTAKVVQIKGNYGFCDRCLEFALLIEENKECYSEGVKVDFTDRETCEGLFMEYYMIIKKQEGFVSGDLFAAQERIIMERNHKSGSSSEDLDEAEEEDDDEEEEEDEEDISDFDGVGRRNNRKRKRKKSAGPSQIKSDKKEFLGWGSRSLIEFLASIGKDSSETFSLHDVTSIVNVYIKENKLSHLEKRKMIICDERLKSLFGRSTINRNRIYDLLKVHFAENQDESDEEEMGYGSEVNIAEIFAACKRQKKLEKESKKKEVENALPQSGFASIIVENVKLVYLKKSLIYELLKEPESFEEKVVGCFVRVKSDPYDYFARNPHQLIQVKGVTTVSLSGSNPDIVLLFSGIPKEAHISLLSDGDFSKEECEDLRQKVQDGLLERPTVVELQEKAKIVHKDITKHWITKEIALLQKLIDRANEKGWRRELHEYLEKKKQLENPSEQAKLLENVPQVIPEVSELNHESEDAENDLKNNQTSRKSIIQCNSTVEGDGLQGDKTPEEVAHHSHASSLPERKQPLAERSSFEEEPQCSKATYDEEEKKDNLQKSRLDEEPRENQAGTKSQKSCSMVDVIDLVSDDDENEDDNKARSVCTAWDVADSESETW